MKEPSKIKDAAVKKQEDEAKHDGENTGELSHGGQHGAEKHLPGANTFPGHALARNEKHGSLPNGELRSAASHPQEADNEDAFSDVSEASGYHLAQDLAEDTEAGFAVTRDALARGMFGSIFRDAHC